MAESIHRTDTVTVLMIDFMVLSFPLNISSEFTEGSCLVLKKASNRLDRMTILELLCEWVFG